MLVKRSLSVVFLSAMVFSSSGFSKVYENIKVGEYDASFSLKDCKKQTFLQCMKDVIYPAMKAEAENMTRGQHIDGVKAGEGVELKITDDISTYHVKYKSAVVKNAERSGRSFAGVGMKDNGVVAYVADASDAYYLESLETVAKNKQELKEFYEAIFKVVAKSDASGFAKLELFTQQVAADFVAVYVAEQYRHLVGGDPERYREGREEVEEGEEEGELELGRKFNWDDALLQATMLASFHSGQSKNSRGMFYEGKFTNRVYNQNYYDDKGDNDPDNDEKWCVYKQPDHPKRSVSQKRAFELKDYWQMNKKCDRSGINLTRSDFSKMGRAITTWTAGGLEDESSELLEQLGQDRSSNIYSSVAAYFINDSTDTDLTESADDLIKSIVGYLMDVRTHAVEITDEIKG